MPLLDPDPDLSLDLQPLLDRIYSLGRYDRRVDYSRSLIPAPSDEEAGLLRGFLKGVPRSPRRNDRES